MPAAGVTHTGVGVAADDVLGGATFAEVGVTVGVGVLVGVGV